MSWTGAAMGQGNEDVSRRAGTSREMEQILRERRGLLERDETEGGAPGGPLPVLFPGPIFVRCGCTQTPGLGFP